jgi:uncharacterized protein YndB with AHSA1/START domain
LARVRAAVAIESPFERVFALVRDQAQRHRFLPDGWRFIQCVTPVTNQAGSQMEIETDFGLRVRRLIEILALEEEGEVVKLVEGPPGAENFISTWTLAARGPETLVELEMDFTYGGFLGEFFIKRRLHRALMQHLLRLGIAAREDYTKGSSGERP